MSMGVVVDNIIASNEAAKALDAKFSELKGQYERGDLSLEMLAKFQLDMIELLYKLIATHVHPLYAGI